jgi:acetyltransferase
LSVRNLDTLFHPKSVAVIGASDDPASVGGVLMRNLLAGGFTGEILPVNPKHTQVAGRTCYPSIEKMPPADVAIVCTPSHTVPEVIAQLGARGTNAAVALTASPSTENAAWHAAILAAAKPHGLRILGPNCLGYIVPGIGLNATFANAMPKPGRIAFVSQSGALCTAVLEWALERGIGFSHLISLGNSADIDFGDLLDYLGGRGDVSAILLYIESIAQARKFMSTARAAARNKPVIAIKAGRFAEGAAAAMTHTGALAGADDVFDAALRRAGIVRVFEIDELFAAVESLAHSKPIHGDRLAILTNGGGPGVLATDALIARGGKLATLSPETIAQLDAILPATWSRTNPVDIIGDAGPDRYRRALEILLADRNYDALLVMNVPTVLASSYDSARAVADAIKNAHRPVLTNWLGGAEAKRARALFSESGIAAYPTPELAVAAFQHMVDYRRSQDALVQSPDAIADFPVDRARAESVIRAALAQGRSALDESEAKQILAAYGVPVVETVAVASPAEAADAAQRIGFPVALKIRARGVTHKSDVGGVALDLDSREAILRAAETMQSSLPARAPSAVLEGFTVSRMVRKPRAYELIVGAKTDPIFGPVILFGQGGTSVEVVRDSAVALPPLNALLAADLVSRTRVSKMLAGFRDHPPAKLDALYDALVRIAQLIADRPEIAELDINPLLTDEQGVLALDARMRVTDAAQSGTARFAIRPYPAELEETLTLRSGDKIFVRPIRPEDGPAHREFLESLKPEDIYFRFFGVVREFPQSQVARYTQIDYDREMAFVALEHPGSDQTLGVVRVVADGDNTEAEFAIVVRSELKGHGIGYALLDKIIRYCRERGTARVVGSVLASNRPMLDMANEFGFRVVNGGSGGDVRICLDLNPAGTADPTQPPR